MLKLPQIALISHTNKVMLKLLQARLQWSMNRELPDVQAGFRKGRGTRDQIANILWIMEKAREFQKNIYLCFIDYAKAFDCVDHNKLWKIFIEIGIPDHLTCLMRNLYAGQEATVRTRHGRISSVQLLSRVQLFANPWITAHQASLSITNSRSSLKLTSIELVMPSSHLILCRPLLLPPIPPSIRVFSNESTLHMRRPWSSSKLGKESRLPGEISGASDMQMTLPLWQKAKNWRASWCKWKRRAKKLT